MAQKAPGAFEDGEDPYRRKEDHGVVDVGEGEAGEFERCEGDVAAPEADPHKTCETEGEETS